MRVHHLIEGQDSHCPNCGNSVDEWQTQCPYCKDLLHWGKDGETCACGVDFSHFVLRGETNVVSSQDGK